MLSVLSREQMQAFDRFASEHWNVPPLLLMENAGRGAAEAIAQELAPGSRVVVVTGTGNNAGDGFVVARRLLVLGHAVTVLALRAPVALHREARSNGEAFLALGGTLLDGTAPDDLAQYAEVLRAAPCVVDAIFGTGLDREVSGEFRGAIELINAQRALAGPKQRVVSLDLPSGLDANLGRVLGTVVRADRTLTFGHYKLGLLSAAGVDCSGEVRVIDIGVPAKIDPALGSSALLLERADVLPFFAPRPESAHKYRAGKVVVFAGSPGKVGAALLVGQGALRAGAGVVTLAGVTEVTQALDRRVQELMTTPLDEMDLAASVARACERADALVVGPGVGLDEHAQRLVQSVLMSFAGPKVLDADALTQYAGRLNDLAAISGPLLLTPHSGELARLLACSAEEIENDRLAAVREAARISRACVLLKGPCSIVAAPEQPAVMHRAHAPALATAGSGDVLAGILGSLATSMPLRSAALAGVFLHARSAEAWQREHAAADRGLLAHEIADGVPAVIAELLG